MLTTKDAPKAAFSRGDLVRLRLPRAPTMIVENVSVLCKYAGGTEKKAFDTWSYMCLYVDGGRVREAHALEENLELVGPAKDRREAKP